MRLPANEVANGAVRSDRCLRDGTHIGVSEDKTSDLLRGESAGTGLAPGLWVSGLPHARCMPTE